MLFDDFRFCYRAPFDLSYNNGPLAKFPHFKYKNYCGWAYFNIPGYYDVLECMRRQSQIRVWKHLLNEKKIILKLFFHTVYTGVV